MKIIDFIKSNSFRCILVLLVIALVCGSVLAVANDLFYVSDNEMFARSMSKIYAGEAAELVKVETAGKKYSSFDCEGIILDARISPDGRTYLVQSKGNKCGYSNGSVTVWVNFSVSSEKIEKITKVVLDGYDSSQSLISSITPDYLETYCSESFRELVQGDGHFTNLKMTSSSTPATEVVASGASFTSRAVNAAVNAAMDFVREEVSKNE